MGDVVSTNGANNDELIDELKKQGFIKSPQIEKVFRLVDRANYLLKHHRHQAYMDNAWKNGKLHISAPCIYANVLEGLELKPGVTFLNLGSGTGYLSTMAGLMIGSHGVSHGIELYQDVINYAEERIEHFKQHYHSIDVCGFCEPQFVQGNGLCLPEEMILYDRVYCGASVPDEYQYYMKKLIKVGGILVMPHGSQLLKITRVEQNKWKSKPLLTVSFASLILPDETEIPSKKVVPPPIQILPLKDICRQAIRTIFRNTIETESPELAHSFVSKIPVKPPKETIDPSQYEGSESGPTRIGFFLGSLADRQSDSDSDLLELDNSDDSNSPASDASMMDMNLGLSSILSRGICGRLQFPRAQPRTERGEDTSGGNPPLPENEIEENNNEEGEEEESEVHIEGEEGSEDEEEEEEEDFDDDESMMSDTELAEMERIERIEQAAGHRLRMRLIELGEQIIRGTRPEGEDDSDIPTLTIPENNSTLDMLRSDLSNLGASSSSSSVMDVVEELCKESDVTNKQSGTATAKICDNKLSRPTNMQGDNALSGDTAERTTSDSEADIEVGDLTKPIKQSLNENLSNLNRLTQNYSSQIDKVVNPDNGSSLKNKSDSISRDIANDNNINVTSPHDPKNIPLNATRSNLSNNAAQVSSIDARGEDAMQACNIITGSKTATEASTASIIITGSINATQASSTVREEERLCGKKSSPEPQTSGGKCSKFLKSANTSPFEGTSPETSNPNTPRTSDDCTSSPSSHKPLTDDYTNIASNSASLPDNTNQSVENVSFSPENTNLVNNAPGAVISESKIEEYSDNSTSSSDKCTSNKCGSTGETATSGNTCETATKDDAETNSVLPKHKGKRSLKSKSRWSRNRQQEREEDIRQWHKSQEESRREEESAEDSEKAKESTIEKLDSGLGDEFGDKLDLFSPVHDQTESETASKRVSSFRQRKMDLNRELKEKLEEQRSKLDELEATLATSGDDSASNSTVNSRKDSTSPKKKSPYAYTREQKLKKEKESKKKKQRKPKEPKIEISVEPLNKYSSSMKARIDGLPLPPILKMYINYNKDLTSQN